MLLGLIPPKGLESFALRSTFHLVVALNEVVFNPSFVSVYKRAAARKDYIVLDNGAAEGSLTTNDELLAAARRLQANEVVVPDCMRDLEYSKRMAKIFLDRYHQDDVPQYKLMGVAQGTTMDELKKSVEFFASKAPVKVIGIPRHMLSTLTDHKACRIDLANWIHENFAGRFQLHLLGTNPVWMGELQAAVRYAPHIRSVDTSMPFSYAIAGKGITNDPQLAQITRPDEYFTRDWSGKFPLHILDRNIRTLQATARLKVKAGAEARVGGL